MTSAGALDGERIFHDLFLMKIHAFHDFSMFFDGNSRFFMTFDQDEEDEFADDVMDDVGGGIGTRRGT